MDKPAERIDGGVHYPRRHDSAEKHVSGRAIYLDDMPDLPGMLHCFIGLSPHAHGRVKSIDTGAAMAAPGVACVLTAADVPGVNDASPINGDDPVFADGVVHYAGQSVFAVAADSLEQARAAAGLVRVEYDPLPAIVTVDDALAADADLLPPHEMCLGEPETAIETSANQIDGTLFVGGQDHFYLEGQAAQAVRGEDDDMMVWSSTQHPTEVQHNVARLLGIADHSVTCEVRRMGGAFGGKESQAALIAAIPALAAWITGRPAKLCLDRDDDMLLTGKRHDFRIDYRVGFDDTGRIQGIIFDQAARCGYSADLSSSIADRAMFHADNAYSLKNARIRSRRMKTNTVSNTAFRGFGGPQGMLAIEHVMDRIAFAVGRDPLDVRRDNLYGAENGLTTPYHMDVVDNVAPELIEALEASSDYRARRSAVETFNAENAVLKKGIALTPVKFGISFTTTHLNQAGALVHVYKDGSVHLNHGGTEMGQGLFIKVAQVVAEEFQIEIGKVKITATTTAQVPNTSPTAASSGSDLNGMAARNAARAIRQRLIAYASETYKVPEDQVLFLPNRVRIGNEEKSFAELVNDAYHARISLSSTGFYRTPDIDYDREKARGTPFFYFAYGAACTEVVIDTLTGEYRVLRVDILHDTGKSLNQAIDLGQIEGGYIQGLGWLTTEELVWDDEGRLRTHAPSTYKIPTAGDRPDMRIEIWDKGENRSDTIYRSKAVGEPPLMLAISAFSALTQAVIAAGGGRAFPDLHAPATPERVLMAADSLSAESGAKSV
ncbi:MAG TPA: xanthine dehydrogenase molybdopterin binding subunit [Afifellaceae bacterium]|nr:xanthine dehydrogenase molybdopterin binding subunit [Afifellaceae bacterium]